MYLGAYSHVSGAYIRGLGSYTFELGSYTLELAHIFLTWAHISNNWVIYIWFGLSYNTPYVDAEESLSHRTGFALLSRVPEMFAQILSFFGSIPLLRMFPLIAIFTIYPKGKR